MICPRSTEDRKGREKYNFGLKEDVKPREIKGDPVCALQTERALKAHLPRPRASVCVTRMVRGRDGSTEDRGCSVGCTSSHLQRMNQS